MAGPSSSFAWTMGGVPANKIPLPAQSRLPNMNPAYDGRRGQRQKGNTREQIKKDKGMVLAMLGEGHTVEVAMRAVGKTRAAYDQWRSRDSEFKERVDLLRMTKKGGQTGKSQDLDFAAFSEKYFHSRVYRHQHQWIDLIEGRQPRELHEGQIFHPGSSDHIVVNCPPGHGKSTTLTMNYVTYKIVTDPNFRVIIISKTEGMAKKFLVGIKRRLTSPQYKELIADYAPEGGYESNADVWSAKMIYMPNEETGEKDPNVECLGIGQQIYGARADLIILDDIEDVSNGHQWEAHMDYIMQDVITRDARLFVVGTRVAARDIYTELINEEHYDGEESMWTYLSQPAVLEFAEDPKDWVTLWPASNIRHARDDKGTLPDENGEFPKWDGKRLNMLRRSVKPALWSMVYMQTPVSEDSIFTVEAFNGCQSPRQRGVLLNLPDSWIVAGLDPATNSGHTACVVIQVDRKTGKRYVIDVNDKQRRAQELRALIFDFTEKYQINEWRIEKNAFQAFLTQDREINQFLAGRGVRLKEHSTYTNKGSEEWGVASMDSLFRGWEDKTAMLDLPGLGQIEAYKKFREQLVTWSPEMPKNQKQDIVMAFWFAELSARDAVRRRRGGRTMHIENPFLSENDVANQQVVDLTALREEREQRNGRAYA